MFLARARKVPNSVNLIVRDEADGVAACHVERWDYSAGTHAFEPVDKTRVDL